MSDTTLGEGEAIHGREWGDSHWVKRAVAITFCLCLIIALGLVFTRVIDARIPEQRATLEKLITERTGLAVRFDNVHFSWNLDGTSAVFTRVELTDPKAGRVRVVAPELRVEFDTWDFLRHKQFSLGHVTLSSPDIEIIGDPDEAPVAAIAQRGQKSAALSATPSDEAAIMRRYLRWAELMPVGRVEVEGARVHLVQRGQSSEGKGGARHSFTLSQAVVSRGNSTFNAYGTMLLSQDVGHSLFVSAKLDGLGAASKVSGDLRVIARKVFLDRLPLPELAGRGTIDARLVLRDGRIESASWQASARELEVPGPDDGGTRFDHVSVSGKLARNGHDVLLDLTDLQLTRGARLERAPALNVRLALVPGSVDIARTRVRADRLPFMATEFIVGALAPQVDAALPAAPGNWLPTAGVLRDVNFDSGEGGRVTRHWTFNARASDLELTRSSDHAQLSQLAAELRFDARELVLRFSPAQAASLRVTREAEARPLILAGELALVPEGAIPAWRFAEFSAAIGPTKVTVNGGWNQGESRGAPLKLDITALDRALLQDAWILAAADREQPAILAAVERANLLDATLELTPGEDGEVNWSRSNGALHFAELAVTGDDMPRLSDGRGALTFARGTTQLDLEAGLVEDLVIRSARIDWPRRGAPRLQASLDGSLDSSLLREVLDAQGFDDLTGMVALDAEARGERELRDPRAWRVVARVSEATMRLGAGLPKVENLAGTIRYSAGQLRGLALEGSWLGGPLEVESRRSGTRGGLAFAVNGVADAAPLLRLLGQADAAQRVNGQFAWTGLAQRGGDARWQLSLDTSLGGLESRLPEPFDKVRARAIPIRAELGISREGVQDFVVDGRAVEIRGQVLAGVTTAHFEVHGISGELRRSSNDDDESDLRLAALQLERAPQVLGVAAALLPAKGRVAVTVGEARYATRSLGSLEASISRDADGVAFSLESAGGSIHRVSVKGECTADDRCRADFTAATAHLATLLRDVRLPAEWPTQSLHASGSLEWPIDVQGAFARSLGGSFGIQAGGAGSDHQLSAHAAVADGQIVLTDVLGTGPEPEVVFRGNGRVGLLARDYDVTVDYERVALAATAVPSPARAGLARAWSAVRGSAARRGWTEAPETRRVQWHGNWD
jgi:hypothetical protein